MEMMVHFRYTYTAQDVQRMLDEKRARGSMRNSAAEKARLERLREAAVDKEDMEEANRRVLHFLQKHAPGVFT